MNRKISVNLALAIVIIAMTVTFSVTMILSQNIFDKTVSSVREKEIMYNKLAEIDKNVRAKYFGDINDDTLFDYLGTGYMQGIGDKEAKYYTAKRYLEYVNELSGKVVSIGVDLTKETAAYPKIIRVYADSPAAEAGVLKGDTLLKVGDTDVKSLTLEQVNSLLRGDAGTNVTITVQNGGGQEQPAVEMQRRQYETPTVEYSQRPGESIGYLRIITFNENTAREVSDAIEAMRNAEQGLTGLVVDVRNNTGGLLSGALDTIDVLCPAGPIAHQKNRDGTTTLLASSDEAKQIGKVPVAVLANANTAAGAELLAVSVRDFELGRIVGTTTAGKGAVQCSPLRLSDGSAISYTVGLILAADGESFDGVGIAPDVEAVLKAEDERNFYELTVDTDTQIAKAMEVVKALINQQPIYDVNDVPAQSQSALAPADSSLPAEDESASTQAADSAAASAA